MHTGPPSAPGLHIKSRLRYNYFRFGKANVRHLELYCTSCFFFNHFTVTGVLLCINMANFVQIRPLTEMPRPTNFRLGVRWRTMTCVSCKCCDLQGHVISRSRVDPMAHKSKTNTGSRSITKIGRRVPHATATLRTSFKVRVTGRLTQTHKVCHIFRMVRPKNFKVSMPLEDVDPHQRQAPNDFQGYISSHKVTWYV